MTDLKKRELELKEQSVQLQEALLHAASDMEEKSEEEENVNSEVQCHESPILTNSPSSLDLNLSK